MEVNEQICRLCLEEIADKNFEYIDETTKEILEILVININFDISGHAVVCNECLEKVQSSFEFKSTCFYVDDYITPFVDADTKVDIRKVFEKEASKENVDLGGSKICRLCLSLIEDKDYRTNRKDGVILEDMIVNCLPEVNFHIVLEPLICNLCLSKMKNYYGFMKTCEKLEERIKIYFVALPHDVASINTCSDLVKFKNWDMINKPLTGKLTRLDTENVGATKSIKCEDIDIKEELDRMKKSELNCSEDINLSDMTVSPKDKKKVIKRTKREKKKPTFFCPKCPYSSNNGFNFRTHMHTHPDNESHRCTLCSFVTDLKLSLKAHMASHRGPTKAFGCADCPFETEYKSHLLTHQSVRHDKHVQMYRCGKCSYSTKNRKNVLRHQKTHREPEEMKKYECEKCGFKTTYRVNFIEHLAIHTGRVFKCGKCPYQIKTRNCLKNHMVLVHSDKLPYSCGECTYTSKLEQYMLKHKLIHQKGGETPVQRKMLKCKQCSYQARKIDSIKYHMIKVHTDPSLVAKLRCTQCPYETIIRRQLLRHMKRHGREEKPTLKCLHCLYVTAEKKNLQSHLLTHGEATMRCDQCSFRTKHRSNLSKHMARHSLGESIFKCDKCEYSTKKKDRMEMHQITHMELGETTVYGCATCDYYTKNKGSLTVHVRHCLKT